MTPPTPPIRSTGFPHNFPTEGRRMAEKVEKLSVHREKDFMYYVKDAAVWKVQRKQPGVEKGKPEKVAEGTFEMDTDFIYFVDRDGDVSRAKRKRVVDGMAAALILETYLGRRRAARG